MYLQGKKRLLFISFLLSFSLFSCEEEIVENTERSIPGITEIRQYANNDYHFLLGGSVLEAFVTPRDGGKLTSLKYQGTELLVQKEADSIAFGSTFWPSPHDWGWPPPPAFDREIFRAHMIDNGLKMEGPVIPSMGLKFIKSIEFSVEDTAVYFEYTMINVTDTVVTVAPWEVTRMPKGGLAVLPISHPYALFDRAPSGNKAGLYHCYIPKDYNGDSQKISFDGTEGWLAYQRDQVLLVKHSVDISAERFAPEQGDVEVYIDDNSDFVELELQGPYTSIAPGDSLFFHTCWYLRKLAVPTTPESTAAMANLARKLNEDHAKKHLAQKTKQGHRNSEALSIGK